MSEIVTKIMDFAVYAINVLGYPGIFVAGSLEFLGLPVSGEVLIPIIGLIIKQSKLNIFISLIVLTIGSVVGTLVLYAVGYYFNSMAKKFIKKNLGKYEKKLNEVSGWIMKHGPVMSCFVRFLPFVRVYISLIAGIERIPIIPFTIYSTIGIGLWNAIFLFVGYYLGKDFEKYKTQILNVMGDNSYVIFGGLALIIVIIVATILVVKKYKKKKN